MTTDYKSDLAALIPTTTYTAVFVPQSKSRNSGDKVPSLNWSITITNERGSITTDYMQGIGHMPGYKYQQSRTLHVAKQEKYAAENGYMLRGDNIIQRGNKIPAPELHDVLSSLLLDADAIDAGSFEEWASDLGYDADSRKAETIYRACLEIGLKLRRMFGDEKLNELRELLRDL